MHLVKTTTNTSRRGEACGPADKINWESILLVAIVGLCLGADTNSTKKSEAEEKRRLIEVVSNDLVRAGITNVSKDQLELFYNFIVVHPSFGIGWDEVPAPTLKDTNAMDAVNAFIAANGWNMHTGLPLVAVMQRKSINGLPWEEIKDHPFEGVTCEGILYIPLRGFGTESDGIVYNPGTNKFPGMINGFKPIGGHWYVWKQTMVPSQGKEDYYEGEAPKPSQAAASSKGQQP